MQSEMPKLAHAVGDMDSRNAPTYIVTRQMGVERIRGLIRRDLDVTYIEGLAGASEEHI